MTTLSRNLLLCLLVFFLMHAGCKPKTQTPLPIDSAKAAIKPAAIQEPEPPGPSLADSPSQSPAETQEPTTNEPKVTASELSDATAQSSTPNSESASDTANPSTPAPMNATTPTAMEVPTPATWSAQRLVIMGNGGPRFFKLDVNVGGQDLEHGFQSAIAKIGSELALDFAKPINWNTLLDKPLVASGWLGNLVPNSEQREQLRGLYDANQDEKVDEPELRAFVTRGLSRTPHLKLFSRRSTAPRLPSNSVWGPVDQDESGDLSREELMATTRTMLRFDFDGDRILTPAELRSATESDMNMTGGGTATQLELSPVHAWDLEKPTAMTEAVFDNYSFSGTMSRELLFAWTDARVRQFDANSDSEVDAPELRVIGDKDLDGQFQLRFPDLSAAGAETLSVNFQSIDPDTQQRWISHPEGGRLTLDGCIVTIVLNDEQGSTIRDAFKLQLGRIEKDAQLQTFAMQALELKEGAIETLKSTAQLQEVDAGDLAWRWMVAPRHWHVQVGWSASDSPWFELMDLNGDQKLVVAELEQFANQAAPWDRNKDGAVAVDEMPISVLLEVKRSEVRGLKSRLGGTAIEKRGANDVSAPTWFTGMDYNSDGELSQSEFLGDRSDFEKLDKDRDGIIEAREVNTPQ